MRLRSRGAGTRMYSISTIIMVTLICVVLAGMLLFFGIRALLIGNSDEYGKTTATITDIILTGYSGEDDSPNYDVKVKYTVDGKEYENYLGSYSSSYHIGKEIEVCYKLDNPYELESTGTVMAFVLIGIGALILIIAVIIDIRSLSAIKMSKRSNRSREDAYTNQTDGQSNNYRFD